MLPYYQGAMQDVKALMSKDPKAIRRLRQAVPRFDDMTPILIMDTLRVPHDLAMRLCSRRPAETLQL